MIAFVLTNYVITSMNGQLAFPYLRAGVGVEPPLHSNNNNHNDPSNVSQN